MKISECLSQVKAAGIELWTDGERLFYHSPNGALTPALVRELSSCRLELIASLCRPEETDQLTLPPLEPVRRSGGLPLSFEQQRLWITQQMEPRNPFYNVVVGVFFSGDLVPEGLDHALNQVVARHEALRTTFVAGSAEPLQVIADELELTLDARDLSNISKSAQEVRLLGLAKELGRRPFDLARGPLMRASLFRLAERESVLVLVIHQIICDGRSIGILFREIGVFYQSYVTGDQSRLEALKVQYADYAVWRRNRLQGDLLEQGLKYWKRQLANLPNTLELAADRVRSARQTYAGATQSLKLNQSFTQQLKQLSRQERVTLQMTLLAAFKVLLSRYSGRKDILIGVPTANRERSEIEGLIGYFSNTLVIRTDMSGNPTFRQVMKKVKQTTIAAFEHEEVPFEKVVEGLNVEREVSQSPIFQVMMVMLNAPRLEMETCGMKMRQIEFETETTKHDLTLIISETDGTLTAKMEYSTQLYDAETIGRMLQHLEEVLKGAVANPDWRINDMPLMTTAELHQILLDWNKTRINHGEDLRINQLFEAQARATPDAIAVVSGCEQLTYKELNRRSSHLANRLRGLGVGPEVIVGVCLERSPAMVLALLGILRAGGAYLPLDPAYPKERLAFMLDDARVAVLLTEKRLLGLPDHKAKAVYLDTSMNMLAERSQGNSLSSCSADDIAYVIYTSSSTGTPMGISLSHRALTNLIEWHRSTLLKPAKTLQFASLSFDVSFLEIFATLCTGGTLFLITESLQLDMPGLARFIAENSIEKMILPVIVLQELAKGFRYREQMFDNLREVITTGEQLQLTPPIIHLFKRLKRCSLHNHYGPSESQVVTAFTLPKDPDSWSGQPSIGRPIANSEIYILDESLNAAPVGVRGELYIGGACLARGYLSRPGLTAEKFIPNRFGRHPGERLYKTGDLARYRPSGDIEYIGRIDQQVNIRGCRVDLGEVEAVLCTHPAVREAVVMIKEDTADNRQLVAFVVSDMEHMSPKSLRNYVKERLPDYMAPSVFMMLDELPLTPSGKVDRQALSDRCQLRSDTGSGFVAARTPVEELVARVWASALGIDQLGVYDNFFDLGGSSLLAIQVTIRLREYFRIDLPVHCLFDAPTVNGLAKIMAEICGGRDIIEEIAWRHVQVEQLSADEVGAMLSKFSLN